MRAISLVFLILSFGFTDTQAAPAPSVIEAAKREGKLIWWTSGSANDSRALIKEFNERYPFVQVDIRTGAGEDVSDNV